MVTVAPGIAPPEGSTTVPEMVPRSSWAYAGTTNMRHAKNQIHLVFMLSPDISAQIRAEDGLFATFQWNEARDLPIQDSCDNVFKNNQGRSSCCTPSLLYGFA